MDNKNYVAPAAGGGYTVVVGGKTVGNYPDLNTAQQQYNNATGQSNGSSSGGGGGGQTYPTQDGNLTLDQMLAGLDSAAGGHWNGNRNDPSAVQAAYQGAYTAGQQASGSASAQKLLDAIAAGDQQKFDEAIREFNADLSEKQREFNQTQIGQNRQLYADTAKALLDTASQLRGPQDYYQFNQFTSGGKDLMSQLFGGQSRPAFSAPTGQIQPETLGDLMNRFGFGQMPGTPVSNPDWQGLYNATIAAIHGGTQFNPDSYAAFAAKYGIPDSVARQANAGYGDVMKQSGTGFDPWQKYYQGLLDQYNNQYGYVGQPPSNNSLGTGTGAPSDNARMTAQGGISASMGGGNGVETPQPMGSDQQAVPKVPLPYQINPAVYDNLGPVGQGLLQSAAVANGWDWNEFLNQLNASRPQGTAPKSTLTSFQAPAGVF